jgi:hypothetical protein
LLLRLKSSLKDPFLTARMPSSYSVTKELGSIG